MRRLAILPAIAAALIAPAAFAQEEPPARVGRVSFVSGQLAFHMPGETAWSAAAVNYPVATGGAFWTDPQSRAEIRIGSQTIDMAGNTELDIIQLNQQIVQISVPQGRIDLHLRTLDEGNSVEIDMPRGVVWLLQAGVYDIDAGSADQPARVAAFDGSAHFVGGGVDIGVTAGDVVVLTGNDPVAATTERAAPDAFVQWCRSRDYQPQRLAAPYYLSPRMTGYEELDEYGAWRAVPDYGEVWFPSSVPAAWTPYREGHWLWVEPWGWNWVASEPWGFAPFHYGRWVRIENRWAWIPGRFVPQPVYAPALVAFIGEPGVGIATGAGLAVGWFPLGPDEVYWPSYTRSPAYIRNLNVANVSEATIAGATKPGQRGSTDPPPRVANQGFANRAAATVVPLRVFANAARVAPAVMRVPPQTLQQSPISLRPPRVTPTAARAAPGRPLGAATASVPAAAPISHPPGTPTTAARPFAPGVRPHVPPPMHAPPAVAHVPPPQILRAPPRPAGPPPTLHPAAAPAAPLHPAGPPHATAAPRGAPAPQGGKPVWHGGKPPAQEEHK